MWELPGYGIKCTFNQGLAIVSDSEGVDHCIDKKGTARFTLSEEYQLKSPADFSEGMLAVGNGSKWGYLDSAGNEAIPLEYEEVSDFQEGLAAVQKDGKRGYIDKTGAVVIPFSYRNAGPFENGLAHVSVNGGWGAINRQGDMVIPAVYDSIRSFHEGLAVVERNGKEGYIDRQGNEVIPPQYDFAADFSDGLASVDMRYGIPPVLEDTGYIRNPLLKDAMDPANYEAQYERARQLFSGGDDELAALISFELLKINPTDERVYSDLADNFIAKGELDSAGELLEVGVAATDSQALKDKLLALNLQSDFGSEGGQILSDALKIADKIAAVTENTEKVELGKELYIFLRRLK